MTTAIAVRALLASGARYPDPAIRRALDWLQDQALAGWPIPKQITDFGPACKGQALATLARSPQWRRYLPAIQIVARELLEEQELDGGWLGDLRHTSQALIGLLEIGLPPDHGCARSAFSWAKMQQSSDGSWRADFVQTANGLILAANYLRGTHSDVVGRAAEWIAKRRMPDGSWLSDVRFTAWAVQALSCPVNLPLKNILRDYRTRVFPTLSLPAESPRLAPVSFERVTYTVLLEEQGRSARVILGTRLGKDSDRVHHLHSKDWIKERVRAYAQPAIKDEYVMADSVFRGADKAPVVQADQSFRQAGAFLFNCFTPSRIRDHLKELRGCHFTVDVDPELADLPWELLYDGEQFVCLSNAVGRRVFGLVEFGARERPRRAQITMALIGDPAGDLAAAAEESRRVAQALCDLSAVKISAFGTLGESQGLPCQPATVTNVLDLLMSGDVDVLHYAGHVEPCEDPECGAEILLADEPLHCDDIDRFVERGHAPKLVVMNGCASGRIIALPGTATRIEGLARPFLEKGTEAFVGTLWPVQDEEAAHVAVHFYRAILEGETVGRALQESRVSAIKRYGINNPCWAAFVLYGDPTTRLL